MISSKLTEEDEVIRWVPPSMSPIAAFEKSKTAKDLQGSEQAKQDARRKVEQEIENARLIGYQNGLADGEARTRDTVSSERHELLQLLASLQSRLTQIDKDTQQALVHFAFELSKTVIRRELQTDEQYYLDVIQRVSEEICKSSRPISITLNPEDVDLISDGASTDSSAVLPLLVKDESLPRGSCLFETPISYIDVGIDSMIERMAASETAVNSVDAVK